MSFLESRIHRARAQPLERDLLAVGRPSGGCRTHSIAVGVRTSTPTGRLLPQVADSLDYAQQTVENHDPCEQLDRLHHVAPPVL